MANTKQAAKRAKKSIKQRTVNMSLRTQLRSGQTAVSTAPPKKVVVDDDAPSPKPKKKPVAKPSSVPKPPSGSPPKTQ